jgi:hypothetical protein
MSIRRGHTRVKNWIKRFYKKSLLETNGFINTKLYDWRLTDHANIDDHSQAYIPHMDKNNGTLISLNVETFRHEF